jgi:hypothetical protein
VIVEDVLFEDEQVQSFEQVETAFRRRRQVDFLPLHALFVLITCILSHFKFYNLLCINFDRKCPLRKRLVLIPIPCIPCFK